MERVRPTPAAHPNGRRMSVFTEVGLVDEERIKEERSPVRDSGHSFKKLRPAKMLRFRSRSDVINEMDEERSESDWESVDEDEQYKPTTTTSTTTVPASTYVMPMKLYRIGLCSLVLALVFPLLQLNLLGVRASTIPRASIDAESSHASLAKRDDSPTDACKRFSGQSAIVNGTLYMYGFRRTTDAKQQDDTWSEFFHSYSNMISPSSCRKELTIFYRQRLPHARPHQLLASRQPISHRPPPSFRPTCRLSRTTLVLARFSLALWRPILRQAQDCSWPKLSLGIQHRQQRMGRTQRPQDIRWRKRRRRWTKRSTCSRRRRIQRQHAWPRLVFWRTLGRLYD